MANLNRNPSIIVPVSNQRKSFWKMVRAMIIPSRIFATFASCGGVKGKRRRALDKYRRGQGGTLNRVRPPLERQNPAVIPPPSEEETSIEIVNSFQQITISPQSDNQTFQTINVTVENNALITSNSEPDLYTLNNQNEGESDFRRFALESQSSVDVSQLANHNNDENSPIISAISSPNFDYNEEDDTLIIRRNKKRESSADEVEFHGWRKSSIDVTIDPPLTLKWVPSGLQVGDKVMWITENQPERAVVRWIGKIRDQYYSGIEFERCIGNSSGLYGYGGGLHQRLFTCDLGFGRFVPTDELILYSEFHDKGVKAGFICVICRDDFLELQNYEGEAGDGNMVATHCGHVYHKFCLDQWFSKARIRDKLRPCPHCQSPINLDEIIRLFPAQV